MTQQVTKDPQDRDRIGLGKLPAQPDAWNDHTPPQGDPIFTKAQNAIDDVITEVNLACREFHKDPRNSARYNSVRDSYEERIRAILNEAASRGLDLEFPTLLSDGKYIHTSILQAHEHACGPSASSQHSSSSVGWP